MLFLFKGKKYRIVSPNPVSSEPDSSKSAWEDDQLKTQMVNAAVASQVSYLSSIDECKKYLNDHIEEHNLNQIYASQVKSLLNMKQFQNTVKIRKPDESGF